MLNKSEGKRNEDISALIDQEWEVVLNGKRSTRLNQLIYEYEMDLLTNPIEKSKPLIEKYVWGLLIAGDYLELGFFLARTKEVKQC